MDTVTVYVSEYRFQNIDRNRKETSTKEAGGKGGGLRTSSNWHTGEKGYPGDSLYTLLQRFTASSVRKCRRCLLMLMIM